MFYESPAAQAGTVIYDKEVYIPFRLSEAGIIYYNTNWTGAPGNTPGFIRIYGEVYI